MTPSTIMFFCWLFFGMTPIRFWGCRDLLRPQIHPRAARAEDVFWSLEASSSWRRLRILWTCPFSSNFCCSFGALAENCGEVFCWIVPGPKKTIDLSLWLSQVRPGINDDIEFKSVKLCSLIMTVLFKSWSTAIYSMIVCDIFWINVNTRQLIIIPSPAIPINYHDLKLGLWSLTGAMTKNSIMLRSRVSNDQGRVGMCGYQHAPAQQSRWQTCWSTILSY